MSVQTYVNTLSTMDSCSEYFGGVRVAGVHRGRVGAHGANEAVGLEIGYVRLEAHSRI